MLDAPPTHPYRGGRMMMREILHQKGHQVVTIEEERSVLDAARILTLHRIGALVVAEHDRPKGILTERDVLRLSAEDPCRLDRVPVSSAMTRDPVVAGPDDELHAVMGVMTERRIRHLPVVDEGRLMGIVSIGDLVQACWNLAEDENMHLRHYIHGGG